MSMMKSVRFHGPGDVRVDDVKEPSCGQGQVKVRLIRPFTTSANAKLDAADLCWHLWLWPVICGMFFLQWTDLHEYVSGPMLIPRQPHQITGSKYPVSMGHEFAGIIEEVGEGVSHVVAGQRAAAHAFNFQGYGGGMSEKIVAPADHFYAIPETVSLEAASFIEPLAVAWHAVKISLFKPGDSVLIVGGGPIGLGVLQVLKLQGASNIIVTELMDSRKDLCLYYGATNIIDPRETNVAQKTRELTGGVGADIIFDTAGVERALLDAIPACRTQGTIVNIAVWEKRPSFPVNQLMYNEIRYVGAALYDEASFLETIQAFSDGHLNPEAMITARVPLDEVVEKGFNALLEHRDRHCKILVEVQS
ncbi:hypothetical protein PENANT_c065G11578 [Penicillium antarcticum]|uniref:Enoyl reductase (ER) domain-containing protein n=1 Tax=Penicillium antarcticum TaxID=416450 RepID=A0A1V6PR68_9EURO|nr:hypothetical protein PENANT_c065G11578 [Penicillium antarcticum]